MYSLDEIRKFCIHENAVREVVSQLLAESKENISEIKSYREKNEWLGIANILHKLYARFGQFKIDSFSQQMKNAEESFRQNQANPDTLALLDEILLKSEKVLQIIENDMKRM